MGNIKSHRDLMIWQKSMDLAEKAYGVTNRFPDSERYGLTSQIRRAAVSVPSNIAEGYYRTTTKEYIHFLSIAKGSLMEASTQIELAARLKYVSKAQHESIQDDIREIDRMITVLRQRLR